MGNLTLRVLSALVMMPVAVAAAWFGSWLFAVFWALAALAVLWEWIALVAGPSHKLMFSSCASAIAIAALVEWLRYPVAALMFIGLGALAAAIFAPRERRVWITAGIGYAGLLMLAPTLLRNDAELVGDNFEAGLIAIVMLFAVVWTTDVFAYFAGRAIGGPKLCPAISPKKTWSGAIAGTLGAIAVAIGVLRCFGTFNWIAIAGVVFVLSAVSQAGDLLESWVKRRFNAKDASQLIPGHGGVMDRLDGFWAAALVACLIGLLRSGFDGPARGLLNW